MNTQDISPMPVVRLSSGLLVANFSSPHTFEFEDGTVLAACQPDRTAAGACNPVETLIDRGKWSDVQLTLNLTGECAMLLNAAHREAADVIIVPLMLLDTIRQTGHITWWPKCRTIRRRGRGGPICIDKFCV